jgi:DNA polymerase I-like protein with 3'-5' exonuclease and polymerase domains
MRVGDAPGLASPLAQRDTFKQQLPRLMKEASTLSVPLLVERGAAHECDEAC